MTQTKNDEATTTTDDPFEKRSAMVRLAKLFLGPDVQVGAMEDRDIMIAVCTKHLPANADKFHEADDAYLAAAYEIAVEELTKNPPMHRVRVIFPMSALAPKSDTSKLN